MINCIAVDDEPLALSLLEDYISKVSYLKLAAQCGDAFEATKALQENDIDLMFIDIQMPGLSGLQFVKSLAQKPMAIFLTAYKQYALEAFDLDHPPTLLQVLRSSVRSVWRPRDPGPAFERRTCAGA